MHTTYKPLIFLACLGLTGCVMSEPSANDADPATGQVTSASDAGLYAVRPYPDPGSVCQVIGESDATREFLDDAALLIGCPTQQRSAIADRMNEGARVVAQVRQWTLLSVPMR
ncbi:hypothetical protein [Primorskyibacter flagellatus]|uniref:Uncharacterized protein n=1 Tax=Primorskyibacter flagellatus TaxID=1387277 RepID=A0A1W1ZC62_9RHOB|nr:hypothetical protein [Primorskyibacter flagellatus]SMC45983.1 hypothetical protein SAMN06295998_101446 [Primorskyibacter flagellatus]